MHFIFFVETNPKSVRNALAVGICHNVATVKRPYDTWDGFASCCIVGGFMRISNRLGRSSAGASLWSHGRPSPLRAILEIVAVVVAGLLLGTVVPWLASADWVKQFVTADRIRTGLLVMHVAGLTAGLGSALFLDLYLKRYFYKQPLTREAVETCKVGKTLVTTGLTLLWISGIGFLLLYAIAMPEKLLNPKLHMKIVVVAILTLNGMMVHRMLIDRLHHYVGRPLMLALEPGRVMPILAIGATSMVSWMIAFGFGMVRELNNVVPAPVLAGVYLLALAAGFACALTYHRWNLQRYQVKTLPVLG